MATTPSKYGRRFDEECKREVAALASKPGAKQEQIARGPGVGSYRVGRWKQRHASGESTAPASTAVSVAESERRTRRLERENADPRERRLIFKKAVALFSEPPRCSLA